MSACCCFCFVFVFFLKKNSNSTANTYVSFRLKLWVSFLSFTDRLSFSNATLSAKMKSVNRLDVWPLPVTHVNSNNTAWHLETRRVKKGEKTGGIEVEPSAQISRGVGDSPLWKKNKKTSGFCAGLPYFR